MKLPFPRSYWVKPGQLLAGFYPGDSSPAEAQAKLDALRACGVSKIINLMEADETDHHGHAFVPYETMWRQLDLRDTVTVETERQAIVDQSTPTIEVMRDILDVIDGAQAAGQCVYVHCWGGKGRTGTVIGCWLARHGDATPLETLKTLTAGARALFPNIPETERQKDFVLQWREGL